MRHPRLVWAARAHPTVGNEAGMCPGINRFTKCAPIADWVRRGVPLSCSRVGSGDAPVVEPGTTAPRVRHEQRNSQNEPGMCLGINRLTVWCGPQTRSPRLAHIAKGAMYAPPAVGGPGAASPKNRRDEVRSTGTSDTGIGCVPWERLQLLVASRDHWIHVGR